MLNRVFCSLLWYLLLHRPLVASTSLRTLHPSWKCWSNDVELFADMSCARNGASYLPGKRNAVGNAASDLSASPRRVTDGGPWGYVPVCTEPVERLGSELCVYTSTTFADGRGISIITSPQLAEELTRLSIFNGQNSTDEIPEPYGKLQITTDPSKGKGALAGSHFRAGNEVSSNVPILLSHEATMHLSQTAREELLRAAVLQLPVATQKLFLRLTPSNTHPEFLLSDIFVNNAGFPLKSGNHHYFCLFPEMALFNHDCAPKLIPHYPY